jgi:Carboxypeptidase regulatory-like domain
MNCTVRHAERVPAFPHLLVIVLLGALLKPAPLYAAAVGSVRGVVHDSQERPVAGADVTIKAAASDWVQMTQTDAQGEFVFSTVAIGDYMLSITQSGFAPTTQAVRVVSGSSPTARIQLAAGLALETVTVSAQAEASPVRSATPTTLVNREDIERTPGAARSNSLAMITNFVPGAYVVHDQLHVRGGHQTTWAVDGVEIPNTNIASNLGPQIDPKDSTRKDPASRSSSGLFPSTAAWSYSLPIPRTRAAIPGKRQVLHHLLT